MHHQSLLSPTHPHSPIHTTDHILSSLKMLSQYDLTHSYYQDRNVHIKVEYSPHGDSLSITYCPLHPKKTIIPYTTKSPLVIAPLTQLLSMSLYLVEDIPHMRITYQENDNVHLSHGPIDDIISYYGIEYLSFYLSKLTLS